MKNIEERVETLERIVNQILLQLNDVVERLDKPQQLQHPKPKQKSKPKSEPVLPKTAEIDRKAQEASIKANNEAADAIVQLLSDGKKMNIIEIIEQVGISKQRFRKSRKLFGERGIRIDTEDSQNVLFYLEGKQ